MNKSVSRKLITLLTALVLSESVLAHNSLTGSEPEVDSTVTTAPETLVLEFSDPAWLNAVTVTDQQGNDVVGTIEEYTSSSTVFSVPLTEEMADGEYTVIWAVEGDDTHIITGEFTFMLQQEVNASSAGENGNDQ